MRRLVFGCAVVLLVTSASGAWAVGKGSSMFAVQLSAGTADLVAPGFGVYLPAYDHAEWGGQVQYWHLMAEDYAVALSAGIGTFMEEDKPGDSTGTNAPTSKYTQSSFNVRIGGDRVVKVGERALLYFGPGIEYWSGKAKGENQPGFLHPGQTTGTIEGPTTSRISLAGRIGAIMMIGESWGFTGSIGHVFGRASVKEKGAETTWWPSSFNGAGGLVFTFGEK